MVAAQHPLVAGDVGLEEGDGPAQVPRRLVGAGEIVAAAEGVGVVVSEVAGGDLVGGGCGSDDGRDDAAGALVGGDVVDQPPQVIGGVG